jgi:hypothetical protein
MGNSLKAESQFNLTTKCLICKKKPDCTYCDECEVIITQIKQHPNEVSKNTQLILDKMYIGEYVKNIGEMKCRVCGIVSRDVLYSHHCLLCGVTARLNEISESISDKDNKIKLVYNTTVNKIVRLKIPFELHNVLLPF